MSYHQSLVSPFMKNLLLEERLSLGLQEVNWILDPSLAASSLPLLIDSLYTGQCVPNSRQQALEVLELAQLLQLDASLQLLMKFKEGSF